MSREDCLKYSSNHSLLQHDVPISNSKTTPPKFSKGSIPPIQFKDKYGNTPLHRAVNNPNCTVDRIKIYLHTSFLNDKNFIWHTPLHCIIMNNCHKMDVIKLMINKGADVNAKDRNGSTPLHKAVQNHKCTTELIDLLIKNGARLGNKQYVTENPLMLAVRSCNPNLKIIDKLFYKACIDVCMKHSETDRTMRILCADVVLMEVFLLFSTYVGPRVDSLDEYAEDEDIIDLSCPDAICGFSSVNGRNFKNTDLATALLMFAVKYPSYNIDVIKMLLRKGACIYSKNCRKRCVLEYALRNPACSLELIHKLLEYDEPRVKWRVDNLERNSFLHIAASNRNCPVAVMKLLLKRDRCKNLNNQNIFSLTPLDCAADFTRDTYCNLEVVEILLINGATTCTVSSIDISVLWKNIQALGSPDANRDVLNCTKLLVKYALVDKMRQHSYTYSCITEMCARFLRHDNFGYFAELTSYLNECFTEVMTMTVIDLDSINLFKFTIRYYSSRCLEEDVIVFNQEMFRLLTFSMFPLYRKLIAFLLEKKVVVNKVFRLLLYTANEKGERIYLNSYCVKHLALYLENEDLLNLYVAVRYQKDIIHSIIETQKLPDDCDEMAEWDTDDNICCCILPPRKKRRLH